MKKLLACLACLMLTVSGALAQSTTTVESYLVEGAEEFRTVTLFESMYGYTLWYDADKLSYIAPGEGNNMDTFIPTNAKGEDVSFDVVLGGHQMDMTLEDAVAAQAQSLRESGWSFVSAQDDTVIGQMDDTSQVSVRVVYTERGFYYLTSRYPMDAIEGWGARFARMAESFVAQPPLRLSFESDVPFVKTLETVDLNESGERAVLWADEPLTNVTLYRVSTADGISYQKETVLYTSPAMKALTEGVLIITFFPDVCADLMAEYTDASGAVKTVLFTQSGKDGRLMTQPLPAAPAAEPSAAPNGTPNK